MRVLVLFAHPVETSFNAALHRVTVEALREAGHEVDDCDLNAEGFNPVLSRQERIDYHDPTKNRAHVGPNGDPARRHFKRTLRLTIKPGAPAEYLALYDMNRPTEERCKTFLETVQQVMRAF